MTTYGKNIKISIYGGSHDPEIGVYAEGVPKGIKIDLTKLRSFMERRAPGRNKFSTQRKEGDVPVFLSGVDEISDKEVSTNGETLHAVIYSSNMRSGDYSNLAEVPRPSHADFAARMKYGDSVDLRGGGHFSGRLTAPLCAVGGMCLSMLARRGVTVGAHLHAVAGIPDDAVDSQTLTVDRLKALADKPLPVFDDAAGKAMEEAIKSARADGDSVGGVIELFAIGLPAGLAIRCSWAWRIASRPHSLASPPCAAWNSARALPPLRCAAARTTMRS